MVEFFQRIFLSKGQESLAYVLHAHRKLYCLPSQRWIGYTPALIQLKPSSVMSEGFLRIFSCLFDLDETGSVVPWLARSACVSPYTLTALSNKA